MPSSSNVASCRARPYNYAGLMAVEAAILVGKEDEDLESLSFQQ
jgi:hypothetical protein